MPKSLIFDMYKGYLRSIDEELMTDLEKTSTQPNIQSTADNDLEQTDDLTQI